MTEPLSPRGHGDVSWIRARLRAAPGGTAALAALVLVTAFLAAALPRAVDGYENDALRDTLRQATPVERGVTMSLGVSWLSAPNNAEALLTPQSVVTTEKAFQQVVRSPLALDKSETVYGVRSADAIPAVDPGLSRPSKSLPPQATLFAQEGLAGRTRIVSGRLPRSGEDSGVEAAVTDRTAKVMGLRAGSVVHLRDSVGSTLTVRITGIVQPRSPGTAYWNAEPDLRSPTLITVTAKPPPIRSSTGTSPR